MSTPQPPYGSPYQPMRPVQQRRGHGLRNGCLIAAGVLGGGPVAGGLPGIGRVVHDGDFAFVVRKITCGAAAAAAVGAGGFGEKVPSGARECIITLKVSNDKGQAQTFFDSNQYAYDARGRQFSADTSGSIYLKGDQDATQVNPGITIIAPVPFQIPAGDRIVRVVLHDSAFSGGVSVRL